MKITANCIVKNEDFWIWFTLKSVLPYVDKILIFDTGSEDLTVKVIKSIKSAKISFEEKGKVGKRGLINLRQEQIKRTKTDWILILDGDEIWPSSQLERLIKTADQAPSNFVAIFNRVRNCIGDVHHFLPEKAGRYQIAGVSGNLNIRLIRKTPDLEVKGEYPLESYINSDGPIEKQDQNLRFSDSWYLHTTFLKRSSINKAKVSGSFGKSKIWEKGIELVSEELPEVFKLERPKFVADPLVKRNYWYEVVSSLTTPIIKLKRLIK